MARQRSGSNVSSVWDALMGTDSNVYSAHRDQPEDALGMDNDQFNSYMEQLAVASPGTYLSLRHRLYKLLLKDMVKSIDNIVHGALVEGKYGLGQEELINTEINKNAPTSVRQIFKEMDDSIGGFVPSVPRQESNNITMAICRSMKDTLDSYVVERIMKRNRGTAALGSAQKAAEMNMYEP